MTETRYLTGFDLLFWDPRNKNSFKGAQCGQLKSEQFVNKYYGKFNALLVYLKRK
jgi:hypothetical protein